MANDIIVVSLKSSTARRDRMSALLAKRDLSFCFFDALDGRQPHVLERAVAELPSAGNLYPGELACALSHLDVWRRIAGADGDGLTLVLEDDVHLSTNFHDEWQGLVHSKVPPGIYRFETMLASVNMGIDPIWTGRSCAFHPLLSAHGGTAAYALNKEVASRLLAGSSKIREAIDIELFHPLRSSIGTPNVYQAYPGQAIQDMLLPEKLRSSALGSQILVRRDQDLQSEIPHRIQCRSLEHVRRLGRPLLNLVRSMMLRRHGAFRRRIAFAGNEVALPN